MSIFSGILTERAERGFAHQSALFFAQPPVTFQTVDTVLTFSNHFQRFAFQEVF